MIRINYLSSWADNALFSLQTALIGIVMVFAILAVLVFLVSLLKTILGRSNKKNSTEKPEVRPAVAPSEPVAAVEEGISPECVAAVMAAIACMYEAEKSDVEFIVRSIKRKY